MVSTANCRVKQLYINTTALLFLAVSCPVAVRQSHMSIQYTVSVIHFAYSQPARAYCLWTVVKTTSHRSSFLACNSRLRSAIGRHHPPQRAVLSQICCSGEHKVVLFQILLDGAEPRDVGTT